LLYYYKSEKYATLLFFPWRNVSYISLNILKAVCYLRQGFIPKLGSGTSALFFDDLTGMGPLAHQVHFVHIADIWKERNWDFRGVHTLPPNSTIQIIANITITINPQRTDHLASIGHASDIYSSPSTYLCL